MAAAALVISIVGVLLAAVGAFAAWRSAKAAKGTERSAAVQAEAARAQAAAESDQLAIERQRFHEELAPALEGSVTRRPSWRGGRTDHILEVRLTRGLPLVGLVLHLPAGSHIGRLSPEISAHNLFLEETGCAPVRPGHPAIWNVTVGDEAPPSFIAGADCRDERHRQWHDVGVLVKVEKS